MVSAKNVGLAETKIDGNQRDSSNITKIITVLLNGSSVSQNKHFLVFIADAG